MFLSLPRSYAYWRTLMMSFHAQIELIKTVGAAKRATREGEREENLKGGRVGWEATTDTTITI